MGRSILLRVLSVCVQLSVVLMGSFLMLRALPGGPFSDQASWTPEMKIRWSEYYGLHELGLSQFLFFLQKFNSAASTLNPTQSVGALVSQASQVSVPLGASVFCVAFVLACLVAWSMDAHANQIYLVTRFCRLIMSLPSLVLAPFLVWIFSSSLGVFSRLPVHGELATWTLPFLALLVRPLASLILLISSSLQAQSKLTWPQQARALGLSEFRIRLMKMRTALLGPISLIPNQIVQLISAAVVVEVLFGIQGLGILFVRSLTERDLSLSLFIVMVVSVMLVVLQMLFDVFEILLLPRSWRQK